MFYLSIQGDRNMRNESKDERFKRVAEKRVKRILDNLRLLSNCSNKRMYAWTDDQLKRIWSALDKELKDCKLAFENKDKEEFKL